MNSAVNCSTITEEMSMLNATKALANMERVVKYGSLAGFGTGFACVWN